MPRSRCRTSAPVTVDVAWGGMFYVIADAAPFGFALTPDEGGDIVRVTEMIKAAAAEQLPVVHPENPGIARHHDRASCRRRPRTRASSRRNAVTVSTGAARLGPARHLDGRDRPLAVRHRHLRGDGRLHAKGELGARRGLLHEGILGTRLHRPPGRGDDASAITPAVVPTIAGQAWITGFAQYVLDPDDPFPEGYTLGDIWGG